MKFPLLLLTILQSVMLFSQKMNVNIFFSEFQQTNKNPYLEIYLALNSNTVQLEKNSSGKWQGGVEVIITINKESNIVAYDKFTILTPEAEDTIASLPFSFQQSRLMIPEGDYVMNIQLQDVHNPANQAGFEHPFTLTTNRGKIAASSILLLDSYKKSDGSNPIAKHGIEMIPIVPSGTYFLGENDKTITFYTEIYNTDEVLGAEADYLIKFRIFDKLAQEALPKYSGFMKTTSSPVRPLLKSFDITDLKSGTYEVEVDVINRSGELLATFKTPFFRKNGPAEFMSSDLEETAMINIFDNGVNSVDTLSAFIDCLYPIASDAERRYAENAMAMKELKVMQQFFYNFWKQRDPANPNVAWQEYLKLVQQTNRMYASNTVPGYRTDMGRVLLQYGNPTHIERSDHDPSNYPYQIWQYDVLKSAATPLQNNQQFIFVDQSLTGRNYKLIHSTAISEIRDMQWQYQLNRHTNRGQNVDATSSPDARDNFGYRVNNNFIIGDQRYWGER